MPRKSTVQKAKRDLRAGKKPSTAAGEFVREEMEHVREGKHSARSTKQAIAIGLSKARRAGVPLKPPKKGEAKATTRRSAARDVAAGKKKKPAKASARRREASTRALKREGRRSASRPALSRQAKSTAARRRRARARSSK